MSAQAELDKCADCEWCDNGDDPENAYCEWANEFCAAMEANDQDCDYSKKIDK
jgi:hypothetical protein